MILIGLFILILISLAFRNNFKLKSRRTKIAVLFTLFTWIFFTIFLLILSLIYLFFTYKTHFGEVAYYIILYTLPGTLKVLLFSIPAIFIHVTFNYLVIKENLRIDRKWTYAFIAGFIGLINLIIIGLITDETLISLTKYREALYVSLLFFTTLFLSSLISLKKNFKNVA